MGQFIQVAIDSKVATLTIANPPVNALSNALLKELAATLDEPELLRYRSNLLGSDLRITNFAGGNTSSKISEM